MYEGKNGTYTLVGSDNCVWDGSEDRWRAADPRQGATVVLERTDDGKIFFLYYHCTTKKWVGRGIKDGRIDGSREVEL